MWEVLVRGFHILSHCPPNSGWGWLAPRYISNNNMMSTSLFILEHITACKDQLLGSFNSIKKFNGIGICGNQLSPTDLA